MIAFFQGRTWRGLIVLYSIGSSVGSLASACTILWAPALAADVMGVTFEAGDLVWHRYIAVFLGCVRLSFWIGLVALWQKAGWGRLRFAWEYTTLVDVAIAVFVAHQVFAGQLEAAWSQVVVSDVSAALIQGTILAAGLFPGGRRARLPAGDAHAASLPR